MWAIVELIVIIAIVMVSVTEFFWPLLTGKPLFGSFRKSKPVDLNTPIEVKTPPTESSFDEKIAKAKEKVVEVKEVQNEVNKHYKTAEQLKDKSDDLLN